MKKEEHSLLYHAMHSRPMPGCLPLFFTMAAVVVGVVLLLVNVQFRPVPSAESKPVAQVTYYHDVITAMRMQLRSPLPLLLPVFADPTRKDAAAGASLPQKYEPSVRSAPMPPLFEAVPASMLVDERDLLALPPAGAHPSADGKAAPAL